MKKHFVLFLLFFGLILVQPKTTQAQCAMCKSNLEKARDGGDTQVGNGINDGIMVLFFLPYIIAGVFGIVYYRNYKLKKANQAG